MECYTCSKNGINMYEYDLLNGLTKKINPNFTEKKDNIQRYKQYSNNLR